MRLALIFLLAISMQAVCLGAENTDSAGKFWTAFRTAVLINDQPKLLEMTSLPLEVRGVSDRTPPRYYSRRQFSTIFKKLLMQSEDLPVEGHLVTKTMLALLYDKRELTPKDLDADTFFRFHQFVFERRKGRWLLVRAYLEE